MGSLLCAVGVAVLYPEGGVRRGGEALPAQEADGGQPGTVR